MKHTILPVIHYQTDARAVENAERAFDAGCDGVLLISMDGDDEPLGPLAQEVKSRWNDKLVGVNYLTLPANVALQRNLKDGLDLTWTDNAGIHSTGASTLASFIERQLELAPGHQFLGAVAFKHQRAEPDPAAAAVMAHQRRMVPCTSGSATGVAADVEKIRSIRAALGTAPLGIASGITPDNVLDYAPFVSHILVATGVSSNFYDFDFERLAVLVNRVRSLDGRA
ncbi:hypothetical protein [Burkholderia cenocepacia]|uniref:hypothetical protein n=1 Tax=Burkholderia cenocepacia TaxID=95486 RepID=UPI0012378B4D|nr:hypothetical protein [Burkholderia cenocepacia]